MGTLLTSFFVILFVAYLVLGGLLYIMQPAFLYSPVQEITDTPDELDMDFEDVVFETEDGLRLNGWYVPAENAKFTFSGTDTILSHNTGFHF